VLKILKPLQIEAPRQDPAVLQCGVSVGFGLLTLNRGRNRNPSPLKCSGFPASCSFLH
jgi:hypothetical protein